MNRQEKTERLLRIWERDVKDNPDAIRAWANHPRSFIGWGMNKIRKGYALSAKNHDYPHVIKPYNLHFVHPASKRYCRLVRLEETTGFQGPRGVPEAQGFTGVQGLTGITGVQGFTGVQGLS